jgi:hypothetical protein
MDSICMYTPSANGGHALYTRVDRESCFVLSAA